MSWFYWYNRHRSEEGMIKDSLDSKKGITYLRQLFDCYCSIDIPYKLVESSYTLFSCLTW